ncbi:MAG: hypothetical protein DRQ88_11555 [Epsilonproteobacteria bacterium]|nr:MAG: hypothetical protein DRQ88_11555 [Campylobacterota bacterium]
MAVWDETKRYNHGRRRWSDGKHAELIEPLLHEIFPGYTIQMAGDREDMEEKIDYILKRGDDTTYLASRIRHFYSRPSGFNVYASDELTLRETEINSHATHALYCVLDVDGESIARWHLVNLNPTIQAIVDGTIPFTEGVNKGVNPFKFFVLSLADLRERDCILMEKDLHKNGEE